MKIRCHIKFRRTVAALAVADLLSIDAEVKAGIHSFKYQIGLFGKIRTVQPGTVNTAGVFIRHIRRIYRIRIVYIGVAGRLKAFHLPVGRNRDLSPFRDLLRNLIVGGIIVEIPDAVQKLKFSGFFSFSGQRLLRIFKGNIIGSLFFPAFFQEMRILPFTTVHVRFLLIFF